MSTNNYQQISEDLTNLVASVNLDADSKKWIKDFIDHNELGVALETFCDKVAENNLKDTVDLEKVNDLATQMDILESPSVKSILK